MIIAVVGGRNRTDSAFITKTLAHFVTPGDILISGEAKGVDLIAKEFAVLVGIAYKGYAPTSNKNGRGCMFKARNKQIAEDCEILMAFPGKESKGTWHTISCAKKLNKRIIIFEEGA